jgi:hypothetical protein
MAARIGNRSLGHRLPALWLIWGVGLSPRRASPSGASSESPAIARAMTPLPSGAALSLCSGLGGRPPTGARWRRRGEIISRGHNGRSLGDSGGSNSILHVCAQVITPGAGACVLGGLRAGDRKLTNRPSGRRPRPL